MSGALGDKMSCLFSSVVVWSGSVMFIFLVLCLKHFFLIVFSCAVGSESMLVKSNAC